MSIPKSKQTNLTKTSVVEDDAKNLIDGAASRIKSTPPGGVDTDAYEQLYTSFF